jgi:hypothetical protein
MLASHLHGLRLKVSNASKHWFNVHHWRAIDHFDRADQ